MSGQDPTLYTANRRDKTFKNLRAGELSVVGAISQCPVILGEDASTSATGMAVGCSANASGINSTSVGTNSLASGQFSTSLGRGTTATLTGSTAVGHGSTAIGVLSTAVGWSSTASNTESIALGPASLSTGAGSIALGSGANAASNYIAIGSPASTLRIVANTDAVTSHHLYIRVNNENKLYAVQLIQTDIDA